MLSVVAPEAPSEADPLLGEVLAGLEDGKAEDVLAIDLRGKSSIADYMVIASGRSARHVASICDNLVERLQAVLTRKVRAQGAEHGDWALIDAGDIIVHVFRPEVREYYALEKMWAPAEARPGARRTAAAAG